MLFARKRAEGISGWTSTDWALLISAMTVRVWMIKLGCKFHRAKPSCYYTNNSGHERPDVVESRARRDDNQTEEEPATCAAATVLNASGVGFNITGGEETVRRPERKGEEGFWAEAYTR